MALPMLKDVFQTASLWRIPGSQLVHKHPKKGCLMIIISQGSDHGLSGRMLPCAIERKGIAPQGMRDIAPHRAENNLTF